MKFLMMNSLILLLVILELSLTSRVQSMPQNGTNEMQHRVKRADCRDKFGCKDHKCWADCGYLIPNQWCWATGSSNPNHGAQSCTYDSDCNGCYRCAGWCTV